jgi:Glycosyl hydrolase catalytic core
MTAPAPIRWLLVLAVAAVACGSKGPDAIGSASTSPMGNGGTALAREGGAAIATGADDTSDASVTAMTDGEAREADSAPATPDGSTPGADGASPGASGMIAGVNVHAYPKPSAYGFTAADGSDRMGSALRALGSPAVRGGTIGDTTFLARLASFGVKEVVLLLSASAEGKPFDPTAVGPLLKKSLDAAQPLGLTIQVEGLNEWDLFNTKSYNAGVLPSGMSASDFVLYTQKALYEAAHPLGLRVLGPSVGHPDAATSLSFFPDVSAYVDVVNMHLYFTSTPQSIPVASYVTKHQVFEGAGKPVWVTETGFSAYGSVTVDAQATVIKGGLDAFAASKAIARAYIYELLDDQLPGVSGSTYTPDSGEYHFGLYAFDGTAKPAAASFLQFEESQ